MAPDAHVAIIRAYSVAEKLTIELGEEIVNVVRCTFSNCITTNPENHWRIDSRSLHVHRLNCVATIAADRKTWMNWFTTCFDRRPPRASPACRRLCTGPPMLGYRNEGKVEGGPDALLRHPKLRFDLAVP